VTTLVGRCRAVGLHVATGGAAVGVRSRGPVELGTLFQHGAVQVLELTARFDAELVDELLAGVDERAQRIGLTAGSIQREHQLGPESFTEREVGDELPKHRYGAFVVAKGKTRLDRLLERGGPQLVQPLDFRFHERFIGDVLERLATPQAQRLVELVECHSRRPPRRLLEPTGGIRHRGLEPHGVDLVRRDVEQVAVAGRAKCGRGTLSGQAQCPPQVRDDALQRVGGVHRELVAPQLIDEDVGGNRVARLEQQRAQRDSRPATSQQEDGPVTADLQRPEDSELQHARAYNAGCGRHRDAARVSPASTPTEPLTHDGSTSGVAAEEGDGLVIVQLGALTNEAFEGVVAELGAGAVDTAQPLAAVVLHAPGFEDADDRGYVGGGPVDQ
jgi:hypothetical protein